MSQSRPFRRHRLRGGSNAVEFALCMPIWVALVAAIMEFAWVYFQASSLNAATNLGCRAGSLIDPGENDANLEELATVATDTMKNVLLENSLNNDDCSTCVVTVSTVGDPPERTLVCEASRQVHPLIGLFVDTKTMTATQVARLEWQRAAAP
ncbi:MAG: pilus assembly protein [Deltaproteobacteria bacterium]|nr:MAG: pilus assembly protein [Deltaproteobacteria bacterium]